MGTGDFNGDGRAEILWQNSDGRSVRQGFAAAMVEFPEKERPFVRVSFAHGTTLTENASSMNIAPASTLNFGAPAADGTILWHTPQGANFGSPLPAINVQAGTLKGADSSFGFFLSDSSVTVAAGATLDLAGNSTDFTELSGGGAVIDSSAAATLTLEAANFSGAILGPLSLVANGTVMLSGNNTYTGTTTIHSGDKVQLGIGGATGSIGGGAISGSGALSIDRDNAITLTNSISGGGNLEQVGTGVTSIGAANTYTGGTTISAGTLAIGNAGALGTGTVSLSGGELLTTANGADGTILWHTPGSSIFASPLPAINVQAGTLKGADSSFGFFLNDEAVASSSPALSVTSPVPNAPPLPNARAPPPVRVTLPIVFASLSDTVPALTASAPPFVSEPEFSWSVA